MHFWQLCSLASSGFAINAVLKLATGKRFQFWPKISLRSNLNIKVGVEACNFRKFFTIRYSKIVLEVILKPTQNAMHDW